MLCPGGVLSGYRLWHDFKEENLLFMTNPEGSATVEILIQTRPIVLQKMIFYAVLTFYFYNFIGSEVLDLLFLSFPPDSNFSKKNSCKPRD